MLRQYLRIAHGHFLHFLSNSSFATRTIRCFANATAEKAGEITAA
jgi:hypothetical protein